MEEVKVPSLTHPVLVPLVAICRDPIGFACENEKKSVPNNGSNRPLLHFTTVIGTISNPSKSHIRRLSKVPLEVGHFGKVCKNNSKG